MGKRKMNELGKAIFMQLLSSETPLPLSKVQEKLGTHFNTLKQHLKYIELAQRMPRVRVTRVGRQVMVETEKGIEDIEFIKEMIGDNIPRHVYLLVELYDSQAVSFEKAIPISIFPMDRKLFDKQAEQQRVIITTDQRVYLTPLGIGIAKGAKRYAELTGITRKLPSPISFELTPELIPKIAGFTLSREGGKSVEIPQLIHPKIKARIVKGEIIIEIRLKTIGIIPEVIPIKEEEA